MIELLSKSSAKLYRVKKTTRYLNSILTVDGRFVLVLIGPIVVVTDDAVV